VVGGREEGGRRTGGRQLSLMPPTATIVPVIHLPSFSLLAIY